MTDKKLKTLKDIECLDADHPKLCEDYHVYSGKELKVEAVKWVKEKTYISKDYQNGKIDFIMDFFNLTEEDLK